MFNSGYQLKVTGGQEFGRIIPLTQGEISLGRAQTPDEPPPANTILFFESTVSRVHARLCWDNYDKCYVIQHLSKTNHTLVNGKAVKEVALRWGDRVDLGKLVLEVQRSPKADHLNHEPVEKPRAVPSLTHDRGTGTVSMPVNTTKIAKQFWDSTPAELEGRRLGHFILGKELGRGSVGRVYLAQHATQGIYKALKILSPEATRDPNFLQRFQAEARIASSLRHPNIIHVSDICQSEGLVYLVMEYYGSRSLQALIDQVKGPFRADVSIRLIEQLLSALDYAHNSGIIHRDVKPANIVIDDHRQAIALTDFSISKVKDGIRLTSLGVVLGTVEYMAPELFEGQAAEPSADLYAVGCVMYELQTGLLPFKGKTNAEIIKAQLLTCPQHPHEMNPEIPRPLADVTMRALEKDPADRWKTAAEMRDALLAVNNQLSR